MIGAIGVVFGIITSITGAGLYPMVSNFLTGHPIPFWVYILVALTASLLVCIKPIGKLVGMILLRSKEVGRTNSRSFVVVQPKSSTQLPFHHLQQPKGKKSFDKFLSSLFFWLAGLFFIGICVSVAIAVPAGTFSVVTGLLCLLFSGITLACLSLYERYDAKVNLFELKQREEREERERIVWRERHKRVREEQNEQRENELKMK
ncbi:MAG TPA: hypothetical protein VFV38_14685 [Ktedonobacteraceae bacterium]|nr:hypothetical protein [Ktedonobacteraceae bacterium]